MFWSLTGEKPLFIVKIKNFAIFDSVEEITGSKKSELAFIHEITGCNIMF